MATTTLLLNGFSIIGDSQTNSNASNGGELMIHDGSAVFEADDIVVFTVENANPDGSLNENSIITGVVVYDNASDYYYDIAKFTYDADPGEGAEIGTGRKNMGDRYLELDASELTSSDPNAPVLDDLTVVAGVDILSTLNNTNGPLQIATNEDIDLNGDGIITPDEEGDGTFSSDLNNILVICYARGTLIETTDGPRAIETLKEGDLVTTLDNGLQPIRWIGARKVPGSGQNAPIHIKAGALGNVRDLWVSPNHRMLVAGAQAEMLFGENEVLIAAKHLVNGTTIRQVPCPEIEYVHFLCDAHQIVFAEGCPSETLFPGQEALDTVEDDARAEIIRLFPELRRTETDMILSRYALKAHEVGALAQAG